MGEEERRHLLGLYARRIGRGECRLDLWPHLAGRDLGRLRDRIGDELPAGQALFEAGAMLLVLISSHAIYHERFPHWVVVTGIDDHFITVHDPLVQYEKGEALADSLHMPIPRRQFQRMARYGKAGQKSVLALTRRRADP